MAGHTDLEEVLAATLQYARDRDYVGWDKHDGMSSRVRRVLPDHRWVNLAVQETIKRSPVNLRPLLLVEQRANPKGLALFALANRHAAALTGDRRYDREARDLAARLRDADAPGYAGFCVGHAHPVQGLASETPAGTPGVVGTSYAVRALLRLGEVDHEYPDLARSAATFMATELEPDRTEEGLRLRYKPDDGGGAYTLNANALAARAYLDLYEHFGDDSYRDRATAILRYVASRQEPGGGWLYTDPPSASHLSMDNYHNGFIVESFLRHADVADPETFRETTTRGHSFYREVLFEDDGAPNWDEASAFPRDSHAAAQGIVTFVRAGDVDFARRIADWTVRNLYAGDGRFYYQRRRFYRKRFTLMRWCQAWLAYALSVLLTAEGD